MGVPVRVVVLALVLALAGCNGLGVATDTPTVSVTPVSPPAVTPVSSPAVGTTETPAQEDTRRLPPGLSNDSVVNASALVGAHSTELSRRSYTLWHTRRVVFDNGTVLHNRTVQGEFTAGQRYRVVVQRRGLRVVGDRMRIVAYSDGQRTSREVTITRDGERRLLRNRSVADVPAAPLSVLDFRPDFRSRIGRPLAAAENTTVELVFPNYFGGDGRSYRIEASFTANDSSFAARNGTFDATVDPSGVVRLYSLSYTTTRHGERVRVRERGGYANLE